jgi:hypothetical protein
MNPKHYQLRIKPDSGEIFLCLAKPGQPVKRIRDMTEELLWCLCADIFAAIDDNRDVQTIDREVRFNDGMACKVSVSLIQLPDWEVRAKLDAEYRDQAA